MEGGGAVLCISDCLAATWPPPSGSQQHSPSKSLSDIFEGQGVVSKVPLVENHCFPYCEHTGNTVLFDSKNYQNTLWIKYKCFLSAVNIIQQI